MCVLKKKEKNEGLLHAAVVVLCVNSAPKWGRGNGILGGSVRSMGKAIFVKYHRHL